jgi:hypothetical protein
LTSCADTNGGRNAIFRYAGGEYDLKLVVRILFIRKFEAQFPYVCLIVYVHGGSGIAVKAFLGIYTEINFEFAEHIRSKANALAVFVRCNLQAVARFPFNKVLRCLGVRGKGNAVCIEQVYRTLRLRFASRQYRGRAKQAYRQAR